MVLLLMVTIVSARTEEKEFTTQLNVTIDNTTLRIRSENEGLLDVWTCSEALTGPSQAYNLKIKRDVEVQELSNLENITKVMEELADVSLQLAKYGNDSKTFQQKYNEKNEAWARIVENYDNCKIQRDEYRNDSTKLTVCQTDLANCNTVKKQCVNTDLPTCTKDLTDQEEKTTTWGVMGLILGALVGYGFFRYKGYTPAEKSSFQ